MSGVNSKDLVSVIVPVFNARQYLHECLDSILAQTHDNIEVVCVNDGSRDDSGDILRKYSAADNRVKVIHTPNGGVGAARNAALSKMSGEWFCFIDADDIVDCSFVGTLLENALKTGSSVSGCSFSRGDNESSPNKERFVVIEGSAQCVKNFICPGFSLEGMVWNKLYESRLYGSLRFVEELRVNEDCLFTYEVLSRCERACLTTDRLYYWRKTPGSATRTRKSDMDFSAANVFIDLIERTAPLNDPEVESTLKINYTKSAVTVLIHADGYGDVGSEARLVLARLKHWRRDVWKGLPPREKLKFLAAVYGRSFLPLVRELSSSLR